MDPHLLSFVGRVFYKLNVALIFAAILALATNSTSQTASAIFHGSAY
jgi:hypothetical protein